MLCNKKENASQPLQQISNFHRSFRNSQTNREWLKQKASFCSISPNEMHYVIARYLELTRILLYRGRCSVLYNESPGARKRIKQEKFRFFVCGKPRKFRMDFAFSIHSPFLNFFTLILPKRSIEFMLLFFRQFELGGRYLLSAL